MNDSQVDRIVAAILTLRNMYSADGTIDLYNKILRLMTKPEEKKKSLKKSIIQKCDEIIKADAHESARLVKELRYLVEDYKEI